MPKSSPTREAESLQHLARVRALSTEVATAISAIEKNDVRRLQTAVANQERISHQLAATKWTPALSREKAGQSSESGAQIQNAYVALAQLNRVYAAVLKRSKRSVELLAALYGNLGDGYGEAPPQAENFQTLSCEA
ncbi:MAG: hypothetical protein ACRD3L_12830 [Terriglobales bacterium]